MKKTMAFLTALTMASVSMLTVSADTTPYVQGDVDMDGVITGHDTAMVSRYLLDETYTLTDEQLALADVNGDGTVNQMDADALYEMQEYCLGDVNSLFTDDRSGRKTVEISDAAKILSYYAYSAIGKTYDFTEVQKNLADLDLDGNIDLDDARFALHIYCSKGVGLDTSFAAIGIYYFSSDPSSPAYLTLGV